MACFRPTFRGRFYDDDGYGYHSHSHGVGPTVSTVSTDSTAVL